MESAHMETIGQRVARLREGMGISQEELARRAGVTQGTISQQESIPTRKSKHLDKIAAALKTTAEHLATGIAPPKGVKVEQELTHYLNTHSGVPVISFIQAGGFSDAHTHFEPGEGDQWEQPRKARVGPRAWAHIVEGWSMWDGTPEGIKPGWIIIADPDRAYFPNAYVIAKHVGEQSATFKQLIYEDGVWSLRPLNRDPQYKTITIDDPALRVIAVVTEARPPAISLV